MIFGQFQYLWLGFLSFPHLLLAAAVVSALSVLFDVAYEAFLPSLLPNRHLIEANSKITAGAAVTEALSFSSGGWLVQLLSAPATLAIDALTFIGSAFFISRVRDVETGSDPDPDHAEPESPRTFLQEAREGIEATWRQPLLRGMIVASLGINAGFGVFGTSMIYYLNQVVGYDPGVLGMIFAIGGASSLAGALLAQRISHARLGAVMISSAVPSGPKLLKPLPLDGLALSALRKRLNCLPATVSLPSVYSPWEIGSPARLAQPISSHG